MQVLRNAKAKGKQLGRPKVSIDPSRIVRLRSDSRSWSEIAEETGWTKGTVQRAYYAQKASLCACLKTSSVDLGRQALIAPFKTFQEFDCDSLVTKRLPNQMRIASHRRILFVCLLFACRTIRRVSRNSR
jgi:hypothetical protein